MKNENGISKRYQLKKDLPTVKAGTELFIGRGGHLFYKRDGHARVLYRANTLDRFPSILADDSEWFEEIDGGMLRLDDPYCYLDDKGNIHYSVWANDSIDQKRYSIGNTFVTEEDAGKEAEWRRARKVIMDDTKGFRPSKGDKFWVAYCDLYDRRLDVERWDAGSRWGEFTSPISFPSRADAEASITRHNREWRIYLGLEN